MDKKELELSVKEIIMNNRCENIFKHSQEAAKTAKILANRFHASVEKAYIAGLLHDLGGVIPNHQRIEKANEYQIELFNEEIQFPLIIHQRLSRVIAMNELGIQDESILNAIECHTTLKGDYSIEDLIVFLADKISWDQQGVPPYLSQLNDELNKSLESAALFYIHYIMDNNIKVVHPWLKDAEINLRINIEK